MNINTKCQVFTPRENVQQLLDIVEYKKNLLGKKIAENSCGDGNILVEIIDRYIKDCIKQQIPIEFIKNGLEHDIFGVEIDINHINNSIKKLNEVARKYNMHDIKWNIHHGDFLKKNITNTFDFVVGNPPYITYKEMGHDDRVFLHENFSTCKSGKFDYCYAFIEASINSLTTTGKLSYLIPSNIFKNQFASALREFLLNKLTNIYDFTSRKLFENKLTASAIIVYDANSNQDSVIYHDIVTGIETILLKTTLIGKWNFIQSISKPILQDGIRFGDLFHTASSIATLLNEAYIIDNFIDEDNYLIVDKCKIEKSLLRIAISPRSMNYKKTEYVIYPYYYSHDKLMHYTDEDFLRIFPFGMQYLWQFAEKLSKRDSDKGIKWFEYGRSQALAHLNQPKLLISTLITHKVKTYMLDTNIIPTSGLYIVPKNKYGLDIAKRLLESQAFFEYVKSIGVVSNGNSFRISPKDINNYTFLK